MCVCVVRSPRVWELPFVQGSPHEGKQKSKVGAAETGMCFGCSWEIQLRDRNESLKRTQNKRQIQ